MNQQELKTLLHYDPPTGVFRWRHTPKRGMQPWDKAGAPNKGYLSIRIGGKGYLAHRLAWMYVTGEFPTLQIDHIDGEKTNNAWNNLRLATNKQNAENTKLSSKNTSGYRGVTFRKEYGKYEANVKHNQKRFYLGSFATAEEAAEAARNKRAELFSHDYGRAA